MPTANLLKKETQDILNKAVKSELYASHLYKHVANQMQRIGYFGAQKFFAGESADELTHYQLIADYMNDRGSMAETPALEACREKPGSLRDALELAYETELQLANDYESWYKTCNCVITQQFLLQFLEIQRKSVGEYGDWLARMDRVGSDECGILMIDKELGA